MKNILVLLLFVLSAFTASAQFNIIGANQIQSNTTNGLILVNTPAKPLNINSTDTTMQDYIQKFIDQFEGTLSLLDSTAVMDSLTDIRADLSNSSAIDSARVYDSLADHRADIDLKADGSIFITSYSGWADYADTQYTSGSPLSVLADVNTVLPNNAGTIRTNEIPTDIAQFYDGTNILGKEGDAYALTIEYTAVPTSPSTTYIETWVDIGGAVGELYRRPHTFPKGQGIARKITFTTGIYTLDTWEANGGTVYIHSNGTANIYNIRFVVYRIHKAGNKYLADNTLTVDHIKALRQSNAPDSLNPFVTQLQLDTTNTNLATKQNTITGAASTITSSNLTANRALLSDGSGKVAVSANIDNVEIDRLDGLSDNIMTLLNAKQNTLSGATSDVTTTNLTASRIMVTNGTGKIAVDPNVNTLHVGYLAGITSSVQGQLNTKLESSDITNLFDKTVDDAVDVDYTPTETTDYPGADPDDVSEALDTAASRITTLEGDLNDIETQLGIFRSKSSSACCWNMDTDSTKTGAIGITGAGESLFNASVIVYNNDSTEVKKIEFADDNGVNGSIDFVPNYSNPSNGIYNWTLYRKEGGYFDDGGWNNSSYSIMITYTN